MLKLSKCDSSELWDRFIETSAQQNVFSTSDFLSALGVSYDAWFLTDSVEPVLGALPRSGEADWLPTISAPDSLLA